MPTFDKVLAICSVFLALALGSTTTSALDSQQAVRLGIDDVFQKWSSPDGPGCAVGYMRSGEPRVTHYYGSADLEHGVAIDADTIFEAGSVSKQFTAAAILALVEQGKLTLSDSVRVYVPELPDYGMPITIDQLINHTSGLRDWGEIEAIAGWPRTSRVYTLTDVLDIAARQKKLNYAPGAAYSYTNTGYNLLAIIVERVSGSSLAQFSRKQFFQPLGMTHTQWRDDFRRIVRNRAVAYKEIKTGYEQQMPFESAYGNGGMLTTIDDLLRWNEALDNGKLGSFITTELQRQSMTSDGQQISYARGLIVDSYSGMREIAHSGSTAGYRAWLGRYPEVSLSLAVLCNASDANTTELAHSVADILLSPPPSRFGRLTKFARRTGRSVGKAVTGDSRKARLKKTWYPRTSELKKLAGRYTSEEALATYQISVKDRHLIATPTGRPSAAIKLTPTVVNTFQMIDAEIEGTVHFLRTSTGDIEGFEVATDRVYALPFRRVQ